MAHIKIYETDNGIRVSRSGDGIEILSLLLLSWKNIYAMINKPQGTAVAVNELIMKVHRKDVEEKLDGR